MSSACTIVNPCRNPSLEAYLSIFPRANYIKLQAGRHYSYSFRGGLIALTLMRLPILSDPTGKEQTRPTRITKKRRASNKQQVEAAYTPQTLKTEALRKRSHLDLGLKRPSSQPIRSGLQSGQCRIAWKGGGLLSWMQG